MQLFPVVAIKPGPDNFDQWDTMGSKSWVAGGGAGGRRVRSHFIGEKMFI